MKKEIGLRLASLVPAYKTAPPVTQEEKLIFRKHFVKTLLEEVPASGVILFIEARAGSGKTVAAQQYLNASKCPYGWYQITDEDRDPLRLLAGICLALYRGVPEIRESSVFESMGYNAVQLGDVNEVGKRLFVKDLGNLSRQEPLSIVLDDTQTLMESMHSLSLLSTLISKSPNWLRWIMVGRETLSKSFSVSNKFHSPVLRITRELRFSPREVVQLFAEVRGKYLTRKETYQICTFTKGWAMGVVFALRGYYPKGAAADSFTVKAATKDKVIDYFQRNELEGFSQAGTKKVLMLTLLDEFEEALLVQVFGRNQARLLIDQLKAKYDFLRCITQESGEHVYSFHHLFAATLRDLAEVELSCNEKNNLLEKTVNFYVSREDTERALRYAARLPNLCLLAEVLNQFGLTLYFKNQLTTLLKYVEIFPIDIVKQKPMLGFLHGICLHDTSPVAAIPVLERSCQGFVRLGQKTGELMARCQLNTSYILIEGLLGKCQVHLERIEVLLDEVYEELPPPVIARALYSLAEGYCYILAQMEKAHECIGKATKLCLEKNLFNVLATVSVIENTRLGFIGDWPGFKNYLEETSFLLHRQDVLPMTKFFMRLNHVNLFEMEGDFESYLHLRDLLTAVESNDLVRQSILRSFLYLLDTDHAIAEGRYEEAYRFVEQSLNNDKAYEKPHTRSLLLQYKAFLLALQGETKKALQICDESYSLRKEAGGNAFIIFNHHFLGIIYLYVDMVEKANEHFLKARELNRTLGTDLAWVSVEGHFAYYLLKKGKKEKAFEAIKACIGYLKRRRHMHYFSWTPHIMETVLREAIVYGIETRYVTKLLRERLRKGIDSNKRIVPLLHISVLESSGSHMQADGSIMHLDGLTSNQRRLMLRLCFSGGLQMGIADVSETLWANKEKTADQLRSSVDNLISQLKKRLEKYVSPVDIKEYLYVQNQTVFLKNVWIDGVEFIKHRKEGAQLEALKKHRQACLHYYKALKLWSEHVIGGIFEGSEDLGDLLSYEFLLASRAYSLLLIENSEKQQAVKVAEKAFVMHPGDKTIARILYDHYSEIRDMAGCDYIMARYEQAIHSFESCEEDVQFEMDQFLLED